ncbi:efflux RND transporter periplasmic adaptor subunit [Propionivibrio sp.]|uniref:efflux RND transporter periplasmic adaptor subunit n=1 Tax=Propionivibrio sp. TaxID=2212460 RepID=UPI003BF17800
MQAEAQGSCEIPVQALGLLLDLSRRARQAADGTVLGFVAVNDSHDLATYRQAALWLADEGVKTLSGVVQLEANAPYVQWLGRVCRNLSLLGQQPRLIGASGLPEELAAEWDAWLPSYGLWLPLAIDSADSKSAVPLGGLLLARDTPWPGNEIALLAEWMAIWCHAWRAQHRPGQWSWRRALQVARDAFGVKAGTTWWKQRCARWVAAVLVLLLFPIRLTVLAPGELVPANPAVIRAPLEGVVGNFLVKPNELVKAGQPLFNFDDAPLKSKLEVARQALSSAEAEYRQAAQLAVSESKYKGQLALLMGKVEERRAEADYLQGQLDRAHVVAPQDGIALFDDPSEWIGKPVSTGERIMRVASPDDVEVEAWLAVGDAIPLPDAAPVSLYLNASPLFSVSARVRYAAHDAVQRPDGSYAYRVRASLDGKTEHRVGLKGTAKLSGHWVPLVYWVVRRPLAGIRQTIGW